MIPSYKVSQKCASAFGERDVSARATHLKAVKEKFSLSTIERKNKIMSKKTLLNRIALTAVSALGFGLISAIPSQATVVGALTVVTTNGTATLQKSDSTSAGTISVKYFTDSSSASVDTASITVTLGTKPTGALGGSDSIVVSAIDTSSASGGAPVLKYGLASVAATPFGTDSSTGTARGDAVIFPTAQGNAYGKFRYFLDTALVRTAGTYTLDYLVRVYPSGILDTTKSVSGQITITVTDGTAAAAGSVSAAGTSTAVMSTGTSFAPAVSGVDDVVNVVNTPDGTIRGVVRVTQLTSDGSAARESITATINIGNIGSTSGAQGKSVTFVGNANGINDIAIYSDGSSGTATLTLKTTSVTFANKTVTFYSSSVDKYEVTRIARVIGSSSTAALIVKAIDSTGNIIKEGTNSTVYAYSDNLDAIATAATSATGAACSGYNSTYGGHLCSFAGSANGIANITIRNKSTLALSTKASTAVAITVNTNPATKVALSFDKATYAPGEVAYLSIAATDASGNPVAPNTGYTSLLATGGITSTVAFGNGSASTDSFTATTLPLSVATSGRVSDVAIYTLKVYMPASGGTVTATATGGTALPEAGQVKVTATATVTDNGAAALAAVTALASQVSAFITKINAQITTLTDLVMKIQKKVKA